MKGDEPLIVEHPFESAEEFVVALSPSNALWVDTGGVWDQNVNRRNWVFRGHSDAEWRLNPSAFRPGAFRYFGIGSRGRRTAQDHADQLLEENEAVGRFVRAAIRAGMPLPEDSQWFRNNELIRAAFDEGPMRELRNGINFPFVLERSLFALAQHHGVPTRLLDWTENPLVGAYFAALKPARTVRADPVLAESPRLAVWALRQLAVVYTAEAHATGFEPVLEFVEAPYAGNPNLQAQRGLFTLVRHYREPEKLPLPTIEDVFQHYENHQETPAADGPWLRKLTLPWQAAPQLLRLLDHFNINAAAMFPGYDGVVRALEERELWG